MEKTNDDSEEKIYNYRSQLRSESCYDDGVWEKNWKNILPKAPEKPSEETGVWRLIDGASDWKDISDDLANVPRLRPRPRHWPLDNDKQCTCFVSKNKEPNKKPVTSCMRILNKTMCDKEVQTDPTDDGKFEENQCILPIENYVCVM
ncbi:hypothetical protein AC249_AIPGENE11632 [Exaiptasia diaphana]|nr:hypothetical protein AC249_AIPGENE11632 [Exaiptasia diaphana]